jgi:hypothetical protein
MEYFMPRNLTVELLLGAMFSAVRADIYVLQR